MVLNFYDYCYFTPARIPHLSLYQLPPESCLGPVTHPHARRKEAGRPGAVLVAAPPPSLPLPPRPPTHRKALPTALVATAPAAVIVLQAQEHQRREDHLPAKEAPQSGSGLACVGGAPDPACLCEELHPQRGTRWPKRTARANGAWLVGRQVLWSL